MEPPAGSGTRRSFELDDAYFRHGQAIAADLTTLDLHGPPCNDPAGPGQITLIDLQYKGNPMVSYR